MITICLTYFRSLTLENLAAALHSLKQQDLSRVKEILVLDNNTEDRAVKIEALVSWFNLPVPAWRVMYHKHGDPLKAHSWSTNAIVREAKTPWILFTRADYILDTSFVSRCCAVVDSHPEGWNGFVVTNGRHLQDDVLECERSEWKIKGARALRAVAGADFDYTTIDAGVWMARKEAFDSVGGLDERLTAWGHAQTHFQWKLSKAGVEFVRVPEVLFYHPKHDGERRIELSHEQLAAVGVDLHELWARHEGPKPYGERA